MFVCGLTTKARSDVAEYLQNPPTNGCHRPPEPMALASVGCCMRLVNLAGRGGLLVDEIVFDVETLSGGRLPSDPMSLLAHWNDLVDVAGRGAFDGGVVLADVRLGPPVPRPPMIFSVVANFPPVQQPVFPMVVVKSPSAITGPFYDIVLPDPAPLPLGHPRTGTRRCQRRAAGGICRSRTPGTQSRDALPVPDRPRAAARRAFESWPDRSSEEDAADRAAGLAS